MIAQLFVRIASGGKRPVLDRTTFKAMVLAAVPFIVGLTLAVGLFYSLAGAWDVGRLVHNDEGTNIPTWVAAPLLYAVCLAVLGLGVLTSGMVLKRLGWPRPKMMALRAASVALVFGLGVAYLGVWLPNPGELAAVLAVMAYIWVLLYRFTFGLRPVAFTAAGLVLAAQLMMHVWPSYRYAYFTGDVYLPKTPVVASEYDSPVVTTHAPGFIPANASNMDVASMTGIFGLLPGDGLIYAPNTELGGPLLFEARANSQRYNPARCPNILDWEELLPSDCHRIGTNTTGAPIYAYNPSLPWGATVAYTEFHGTFVMVLMGFMPNDETLVQYMSRLQPVRSDKVGPMINANRRLVDDRVHGRHEAEKAKKDAEDTAYTNLSFKILQPTTVPAGWKLDSKIVMGGDPGHPTMVELEYANKTRSSDEDWVSLYMAPKSTFDLGTNGRCGPTPGFGAEYIPCAQLAGTQIYEATYTYSQSQPHLAEIQYRVVGDVMVISVITHGGKTGDPLSIPESQRQIRDAIVNSLKASDNGILRGAMFTSPLI